MVAALDLETQENDTHAGRRRPSLVAAQILPGGMVLAPMILTKCLALACRYAKGEASDAVAHVVFKKGGVWSPIGFIVQTQHSYFEKNAPELRQSLLVQGHQSTPWGPQSGRP
jgi:hypothetical protein